MASRGSTCNVLHFFRRQFACALAGQYSVRLALFQHDLILSSEMVFAGPVIDQLKRSLDYSRFAGLSVDPASPSPGSLPIFQRFIN
jgi:hypothetical protein